MACLSDLNIKFTDQDPYPLISSLPLMLPQSLTTLTLSLLPFYDFDSFLFLLDTTPCLRSASLSPRLHLTLPFLYLDSTDPLDDLLTLFTERSPTWTLETLVINLFYLPSIYDFEEDCLTRHRKEWLTHERHRVEQKMERYGLEMNFKRGYTRERYREIIRF